MSDVAGTDLRCIHNRRIDVSAAFFIELEFQETGSVVYRMHRVFLAALREGLSRKAAKNKSRSHF